MIWLDSVSDRMTFAGPISPSLLLISRWRQYGSVTSPRCRTHSVQSKEYGAVRGDSEECHHRYYTPSRDQRMHSFNAITATWSICCGISLQHGEHARVAVHTARESMSSRIMTFKIGQNNVRLPGPALNTVAFAGPS